LNPELLWAERAEGHVHPKGTAVRVAKTMAAESPAPSEPDPPPETDDERRRREREAQARLYGLTPHPS
jgi:hypothetical protein